jgi:hypothetical protein
MHLWPCHHFEDDHVSPYFIYVHTFSAGDLSFAPPQVTFSRPSLPPSQAYSDEPPFHPMPPIGPLWTWHAPRQHLPRCLTANMRDFIGAARREEGDWGSPTSDHGSKGCVGWAILCWLGRAPQWPSPVA